MADQRAELPEHITGLDGPEARRRLAEAEAQVRLWIAIASIPIHQQIIDKIRCRVSLAAYDVLVWAGRRGRV